MSNFVGATLVVARPGPTRMPRSKEADSAAWRMVQTLRKDQVEKFAYPTVARLS